MGVSRSLECEQVFVSSPVQINLYIARVNVYIYAISSCKIMIFNLGLSCSAGMFGLFLYNSGLELICERMKLLFIHIHNE